MPADPKRLNLARLPLREQILPLLREDLIANRWQPGERLSEPDLCSEFGVSRTPLRDAFKKLEAEGLVNLLPNIGALAADLAHPELAERIEAMSRIEEIAAINLARNCKPETLSTIDVIHADMAVAATSGDVRAYYSLNDKFHRTLVQAGGNSMLTEVHEQFMMHVHRARHWVNEYEPLDAEAHRNHDPIVEAIKRGDALAAGDAVRDHLQQVSDLVLRKINETAG